MRRREGELARGPGERGEASKPRVAPANGELDQVVDSDPGRRGRGGAQPALAPGGVEDRRREPDRDPDRPPLAPRGDRPDGTLWPGIVVARPHRREEAPVQPLQPLYHRAAGYVRGDPGQSPPWRRPPPRGWSRVTGTRPATT